MAESYSKFAEVYDELMDATPYEEWRDRIIELIREYGVSKPQKREEALPEAEDASLYEGAPYGETEYGQSESVGTDERQRLEEELLDSERDLVVDLGCGTGTLTEMLYKAGYDMIGIDYSESMLEKAMEKRDESGAEILYLQQDMRELSLYSTVGTVISVCDSVNYLLEKDELLKVFSLVNNYLYPGGIFIFDFNTDYKYREVLGDCVIAENRDDCSFIWENDYDSEGRINEYDLTIFLQREGELFERVTETHLQRGYQAEEMMELLEKAGLQVILMRDADTEGNVRPESERILLVAKEVQKDKPTLPL